MPGCPFGSARGLRALAGNVRSIVQILGATGAWRTGKLTLFDSARSAGCTGSAVLLRGARASGRSRGAVLVLSALRSAGRRAAGRVPLVLALTPGPDARRQLGRRGLRHHQGRGGIRLGSRGLRRQQHEGKGGAR